MKRKELTKSTLIVLFSFLLTSIGHLAWMYHLMTMTTARVSDLLTVIVGYLVQAFGIAVFAVLQRRLVIVPRRLYVASVVGYSVFLIPSVIGTSLAGTAAFGTLLSLCCGMIAGYYLFCLTSEAPDNRRAVSFGTGYGVATVAAWLLSLLKQGRLYYGNGVLFICFTLAALSVLCTHIKTEPEATKTQNPTEAFKPETFKRLLFLSGAVVFLFSLVNNIGFSFSTPELQSGVRLEFSRLFYAFGLISAGFVTDKSRKGGAVCTLAALIIPFIIFALRSETVATTIFWALSYFAFGYYSVYRVILFSDAAKRRELETLSGFGLLTGRIGDAFGSALSFSLSENEILRVAFAAALFIAAVFSFFKLYQMLYVPTAQRHRSEREIFDDFSVKHDLSAREREVLRLVLEDKTNKEISDVIFISENTVKFHMHNLLQKTGCKSRGELKALYHSYR